MQNAILRMCLECNILFYLLCFKAYLNLKPHDFPILWTPAISLDDIICWYYVCELWYNISFYGQRVQNGIAENIESGPWCFINNK